MLKFKETYPEYSDVIHQIFPGEHGKYWVNFNWYWLEISRKRFDIQSVLIEIESSMMGFAAFGKHFSDRQLKSEVPGSFELYHMVIDESKQGQGLGRAATILILQKMAQQASCENLIVACHPDNKAATALYKSLGFQKVGKNYDEDPLYLLKKKDALELMFSSRAIKEDKPREGAEKWSRESILSHLEFDWAAWESGLET